MTACTMALSLSMVVAGGDVGNRLVSLDEFCDPYYAGLETPKLVTPQWVGEEGVEAVIVLANDDLRDPAHHEKYIRPILRRLKQIDKQAGLSLMANTIVPTDPQLQSWLREGVTVEVHTFTHPCPCLQGGDLAKAKATYDKCVDLLRDIPNARPVSYRMPCCDSMNSVSPRFFAEIFNRTTEKGNFQTMDSSVFHIFSANDPALPRRLAFDQPGRERFRKYVPTDHGMVNLIEDYPYPYVIGRLCWEIACLMPSDWDAQHLNGKCSPTTVADLKAAVDAAVIKRGIFSLCFHTHGWIRNDQVIEMIDHAEAKHPGKVKFLSFRDVQDRLDKNLLGGQPLRAANGQDNGVRLIDLNADGYLDVVIGNEQVRQTRVWSPQTGRWQTNTFPVEIVRVDDRGNRHETGVRFGVLQKNGFASILVHNETAAGLWHFDGSGWTEVSHGLAGLDLDGPVETSLGRRDRGVRLRDLDGDGLSELVVGNPKQNAVFAWSAERRAWRPLPIRLPAGTMIVDELGRDAGLRFVDVDEDGRADVLFSNAERYSLHQFISIDQGWSRKIRAGRRGDKDEIPMIVRADGTNNGAWFNYRHMWVQNEETGKTKPNQVDGRSFTGLLVSDIHPPPRSPEASMKAIQVHAGMKVELVAAEPLVMDPVDFAWGPDGKLWVAEMADYPLGLDDKGKIGGRIRFLEDTDGDGRYDRSTVFLEPVGFPSGVMPWRKGVLVTAAPEMFYAEDTDGDGKADVRKPLFTGFIEGNQQHRFNHPRWGLDNWVHLANGDSNGKIRSVKTGQVMNINGLDLRVRPDDGRMDVQSGRTQFSRNRDDWGNWFGCNNPNPGWHYVLADRYIRRNPHVAPPAGKVYLGEDRNAYPGGRVITHCFFEQPTPPEGEPVRWTAVCGVTIYRDELLGPNFAGNLFVSDSVYNCVHRMIVTPNGVTFRGRRAPEEQRTEFLASADPWSRPNTVETGPDGALWFSDMYRFVIEHPEWIDVRLIKKLDLRAGHDKGRIYRVYPIGSKLRPIPRLDTLDTAALVAALDSPNGWQRDMAQRMLLWRADKSAIGPLEKMAATSHRALARLHALCTLDGLGALRAEVVLPALADRHPGVRRHAVRLSESFLGNHPGIGEALLKLADDPDAQVRMQLAYSLGEWDEPRAARVLGRLAARSANDPYMTAAVLSSATRHLEEIIGEVLPKPSLAQSRADLVSKLLLLAAALDDQKTLAVILRAITAEPPGGHANWQYALMARALDGLARQRTSLGKLHKQAGPELKEVLSQSTRLFQAARHVVADPDAALSDRMVAMKILGRGLEGQDDDLKTLAELLVPQNPVDLQLAAVASMGRLRREQVPQLLLKRWIQQGPKLRSAVLDVLLSRPEWISTLLDAVETRPEVAAGLGTTRRNALLRYPSDPIRRRAEKLFGQLTTSKQIQAALKQYKPVLHMSGDPARGKKVFEEATCSKCHKLEGVGKHIGPDLRALVDKSPQALLVAVLDPNRAVEDRFLQYSAVTTDGLVLAGMLTEETSNSITLADAEGKLHTLLRKDVDELIGNNISSMPDGLKEKLSLQQMADLFAFIDQTGPAPKQFPGNKPERVMPGADGSLDLTAAKAEIYGPDIQFEPQYKNLGQWSSGDAYAAWSFEVAAAGDFNVSFNYACYSGEADKPFLLEVAGQKVRGTVASTGRWNRYVETQFGRVHLEAGENRLTFRSDGRIAGPLIDIRTIRLVPVAQ